MSLELVLHCDGPGCTQRVLSGRGPDRMKGHAMRNHQRQKRGWYHDALRAQDFCRSCQIMLGRIKPEDL